MKKKPRLLDLFCGAGGCAVGYARAGFEVVGVDLKKQPRYPFRFLQADAMLIELDGYDAIHASPPCQCYSSTRRIAPREHPDLVDAVRERLVRSGVPWVIENVPGAPLVCPALVCGLALGLGVKRHRLFEGSHLLLGTTCPIGHRDKFIGVFGHGAYRITHRRRRVSVHGGGAPALPDSRQRAGKKQAAAAMGIDWMTQNELSQAIPPATRNSSAGS